MDATESLVRGAITGAALVAVCYAILLVFRLVRWLFRSASSSVHELPRQAGSAAAKAVDVARTVKDGFVDGYKRR